MVIFKTQFYEQPFLYYDLLFVPSKVTFLPYMFLQEKI